MIAVRPRRGIDMRRALAVLAGKLSATASRTLGRGGGTTFPGLVATRLDPGLVGALTAQLACGSVVVSGTNGKTTTSRMLAAILKDAGYTPLRNEAGSNLMRGLASSLIRKANVFGNLSGHDATLGLFEVDEAAVPPVVSAVRPGAMLLLDLFRDQLDRYGEVASVARLWAGALAQLPETTAIVANADDPLVAQVVESARRPPVFFGIQSAERSAQSREHASDVKACPRCGGPIEYNAMFLGHLGHYRCSRCDFRRPSPQVLAADVRLDGVAGSAFRLIGPDGEAQVTLPLPGLYNVYNAVAAAAAGQVLGIALSSIATSLGRVTPAFGRMERLEIERRPVYLALAKNPAGLNEVLRTLAASPGSLRLMVMLNDNTADGHDVSWIWDADIEMLHGRVASVVFGGIRAEDMALRFKYAGVIDSGARPLWEIMHNTEQGFWRALEVTPPGEPLFIVPTYTAMLDIRKTLTRLDYVKPYWEI